MFGRKLLFPTGGGFKLPLAIISDKHKLHDIIAVKGRLYSINCVPGMVRPSTGKKYVNYYAVRFAPIEDISIAYEERV